MPLQSVAGRHILIAQRCKVSLLWPRVRLVAAHAIRPASNSSGSYTPSGPICLGLGLCSNATCLIQPLWDVALGALSTPELVRTSNHLLLERLRSPLSTMNAAVCFLALAGCLVVVVQAQQFDRVPRLHCDGAVHCPARCLHFVYVLLARVIT